MHTIVKEGRFKEKKMHFSARRSKMVNYISKPEWCMDGYSDDVNEIVIEDKEGVKLWLKHVYLGEISPYEGNIDFL